MSIRGSDGARCEGKVTWVKFVGHKPPSEGQLSPEVLLARNEAVETARAAERAIRAQLAERERWKKTGWIMKTCHLRFDGLGVTNEEGVAMTSDILKSIGIRLVEVKASKRSSGANVTMAEWHYNANFRALEALNPNRSRGR